MMKKMRNICATILTVAVVYLITINTTIISYAETEVETISIPVILNYTGDAWVDQNGNLMNMETAENFLNNNPDYTRRILSLNQNAQYAAALQNETRSEVIEEFEIYSSKWQSGAYHSSDMSAFWKSLSLIRLRKRLSTNCSLIYRTTSPVMTSNGFKTFAKPAIIV